MGSFLDLNVGDAVEYKPVPAGEYQLKVVKAELKEQKPEKGTGRYISVRLILVDDPYAKDVNYVMMLPSTDNDVKTVNNRKLNISRFIQAMGEDPSAQIDLDTWEGNTLWAILKEVSDDYGDKNEIKSIIVRK